MKTAIEQFVLDRMSAGQCSLESALVEHAAIRRGIAVDRLDGHSVVVETGPGAWVPFDGLDGPDTSHAGARLCRYRDVQRWLLQSADLPVPHSDTYAPAQMHDALAFADGVGWPVTVSPARASGATTAVTGADQFAQAWDRAVRAYRKRASRRPVLVQAQIPELDYRVVVVAGRVVSVTRRDPPSVVGDGRLTVRELIRQKNSERHANPCLAGHPIPDDPTQLPWATVPSRALDSAPQPGERVMLSHETSLAEGADVVDVTDELPVHWRDLALDAMRVLPGLIYAEVHLAASNHTGDMNADSATVVITNVSRSPVPVAHFPVAGQPRDVAGAIIDHYVQSPRWIAGRETAHEVAEALRPPPAWLGPMPTATGGRSPSVEPSGAESGSTPRLHRLIDRVGRGMLGRVSRMRR